jgi:hypothetical protein
VPRLRQAGARRIMLVREKPDSVCCRLLAAARALSDIVKRRSIRAHHAAQKPRAARYLHREIGIRKLSPDSFWCRHPATAFPKCRRSLTASPSVRSYEASWSF